MLDVWCGVAWKSMSCLSDNTLMVTSGSVLSDRIIHQKVLVCQLTLIYIGIRTTLSLKILDGNTCLIMDLTLVSLLLLATKQCTS